MATTTITSARKLATRYALTLTHGDSPAGILCAAMAAADKGCEPAKRLAVILRAALSS